MSHPFHLVDVFSQRAFMGNPVAVILDAPDADASELLTIARWLNLSETTFLLPPTTPEADYRVRIFTLEREMPFAGHPTLGSARAWLDAGGTPNDPDMLVQECGAGLVRIRRDRNQLAFAAPPLTRSGPVDDATVATIANVLNLPVDDIVEAQWCDNGPGWAAVMLGSADDVLAIKPATSHATRIDIGVVGPYPADHEYAFEVRALFSDHTGALREDPVTGSLNAAVAAWMIDSGRIAPPFRLHQGGCVGRDGRIFVSQDKGGTLWVGGHAQTLFVGQAEGDGHTLGNH